MHPALIIHECELRTLCRRFHVRRLELFGSAAKSESEPNDIDFLVEFEPLPLGTRASTYFGLQAELEQLFARPVDLVMTKAISNRRFLRAIEGDRTPLYAA